MKEQGIQNSIRIALSKAGARLFRNNVGKAWIGESSRLKDGSVLISNPRVFHAGLCVGSSDLIGWTSVKITDDMVGSTIAVFTSIEVKSKRGRAKDDQKAFIAAVKNAGGFAGIAKSDDDALEIIGKRNDRCEEHKPE